MKQKIEGGWEAGKLIDWEEVERELEKELGLNLNNEVEIIFGRYGVGMKENERLKWLESFLHSKLLAQQKKTEKVVLERVRGMIEQARATEAHQKDDARDWHFSNCTGCAVENCLDDLLSKLSEMEEQ